MLTRAANRRAFIAALGSAAGAGGGAATGDADDLVSRERVGGACCEYVGFAVKR